MPIILEQGMSTDFFSNTTVIESLELAEMDVKDNCSIDSLTFITWNPNDKVISPISNDLKWMDMCCTYLKHFTRCCKYFCFQPEFSISGRLHIHGWIVIHDKIKWIKAILPMLMRAGRVKIDKARSWNGFDYYKKEVDLTDNILKFAHPFSHLTSDEYLYKLYKHVMNTKTPKKVINHIDITRFFPMQTDIE